MGRDKCWLDREDFANSINGENFDWGARGYDSPVFHQHNLIGKTRGQIQVVNHADRYHVRRCGKRAHLFHEIYLMPNVEKSQRLVE